MIGSLYASKKSSYNPPSNVKDLTSRVQQDYETGQGILDRSWTELNNRSVIEDENMGQRMANAFVDESVEDPSEAWKWRGTRSMARNKGIAMMAQLTASFIVPGFTAQNDDDETDREFSEMMEDCVQWMVQPQNSEYQSSFVSLVLGMIESPVTYLGAEWFEVFQEIKVRSTDKTVSKQKVLDDVLSGFKAPVYSSTEILINNAYERNIQKQKCIIPRRWIEYSEAEAKYSSHPNWVFVVPGVQTLFDSATGLFYDVYDSDHPTMVHEVVYQNRREDLEVPFISGIYMGDPSPEDNPMKHRDHKGAPKYNIVPFGFNRIGKHFFYFKSMMSVMRWDNALYDAMSEILMNRAILEVEPPVGVTGTDKIDSDVVFPNSVVAFSSPDVKISNLLPPANMAAGFQALTSTKDSMDDASLSDTMTGQLPSATQKAYTVAQAQANAKKLIQGVTKSLAESIVQFGPLMANIVVNHLMVPQIDEVAGKGSRVRYRKLLLEKQMVDGKEMDKEIRFEENLVGKLMTPDQKQSYILKQLESTGYPQSRKFLRTINPHLASKFRYLARIDPEEMFPRSAEAMQALLTNLYAQLINDPYINHEMMARELMTSYFRGRGEKFINKNPQLPPSPTDPTQRNPAKDQLGSMMQAKNLGSIAQSVGGGL